MREIVRLENLRQRLALRCNAESLRRLLRLRCLMAQRLPQPPNSVICECRAEEYRYDLRASQRACQVAIDLVLRRLDLLQQLFQEGVVEIRQLLDEAGTGGPLLIPEIVGQRDQIRGLSRAVAIGAFADQVDIAGDLGIRPAKRDLTKHERPL